MANTDKTETVVSIETELKISEERGEGVFAKRTFKPGETVMIGKFLRRLEGNSVHATQIGQNEFILEAGLLSKVNHSCDPVCGLRENETGARDLVAIKNIEAGQEITYDYAMGNFSIEFFPAKCLCGTSECRGTITGWKDLTPEKQEEYAPYSASYLTECVSRR